MPETQESARRWSGFVCPDCRFVFRVAREHDGRGVVCPSCKRLLKIPQPGETTPPLVALSSAGPPAESGGAGVIRKRRKRRKHKPDSPDWEAGTERPDGPADDRASFGLPGIIASLSVLLLLVAVVIFLTRTGRDDLPPANGRNTLAWTDVPAMPADEPADETPALSRRSDAAFLTEAEPIVRAFLEATTVEEILKWVDQPDVVAKRITRPHPDGTLNPPGMAEYSRLNQIEFNGAHGTFDVRTKDYLVRPITLRDDPEELKVDWESWVGWSDVPWDAFLDGDAESTAVFRVLVRKVEYYNFDFADDRTWQSYRIESPDREHSIFGYVERGTLDHTRLQALTQEEEARAMLELHLADESKGRGQLAIRRVVSKDWIAPERRNEP